MRLALAFSLLTLMFALPAAGSTPSARILFDQPVGSSTDLVETDADATSFLNLTPGQQTFYVRDTDGSWSPDGVRIVFTSERDSNVASEIYVMNADGSDQTRLTHDGPDGVQNVGGGVFDASPVWSPRGDEIAYLKVVNGAWDVWLMRPDGSGQHQLTFDGGPLKTALSWSPDGTRLVYEEQNQIWVVSASGGPPAKVANGNGPAWSPDGSRIAYGAGNDGLWTVRPDGAGAARVASVSAQFPAWSPDGSRLAFLGTRIFPELTSRFGPASRQDIYTVSADGSDLRRLTGPLGDGFSSFPSGSAPSWWPDGSRLFFLSQRMYPEQPTTYVMNADGSCEGAFAPAAGTLFRPVWRPGSRPGLGPIRCADLRVELGTPAGPVGPAALGQVSELAVAVDNDGNETATGVRVELKTTDPHVELLDAENGAIPCGGYRDDLTCTLAALPVRVRQTISFGVRSATAGNFPLTVTATAIEPDTDLSTNTLETGEQVLPCTEVGTYGDDVLSGTAGPDRICGLTGADRIYGGAGDDYLNGDGGADIIAGGPGHDTILGKGGNDTIYARDGQRDYIDCGSERDVAIVDRVDHVSHCETVVRPRR